jgi:hypothetical protein
LEGNTVPKYKHKIPLHLEQEDHIVVGLTARQMLLIGAGLAAGYLAWSNLSFLNVTSGGFLMNCLISLMPALSGLVAAFFRPASRGLEEWALVAMVYLVQPTRYLWDQLPARPEAEKDEQPLNSQPFQQEEEG